MKKRPLHRAILVYDIKKEDSIGFFHPNGIITVALLEKVFGKNQDEDDPLLLAYDYEIDETNLVMFTSFMACLKIDFKKYRYIIVAQEADGSPAHYVGR